MNGMTAVNSRIVPQGKIFDDMYSFDLGTFGWETSNDKGAANDKDHSHVLAMLIVLFTLDLWKKDKQFDMTSFMGRYRLYSILLNNFFPDISVLMDASNILLEHEKPFGSFNVNNLLFPANLGELNLRLIIMFQALTKIELLARERQKQRYNEIGLVPLENFIPSLFTLPNELKLKRTKSLICNEQKPINYAAKKSSLFFMKSNASLTVAMYGCGSGTSVVSKGMAKKIAMTSEDIVESTTRGEATSISDYIARIFLQAGSSQYTQQTEPVIVPTRDEMTVHGKSPIEKPIKEHINFMKPLCLDLLFEMKDHGPVGILLESYVSLARIAIETYQKKLNEMGEKKGLGDYTKWELRIKNIKEDRRNRRGKYGLSDSTKCD